MATGYVKLHREAEDHPVFDDPWLWKVFTWCIMRANFRDGRDKRGSFSTGRFRAAEQLRATPSRVYEAWRRLERMGCITVKANSQFTTITICNYETYQSDDDATATTKQQPSDNDPTTKQQQSNNDPTQEEEWKNDKKGKKERSRGGGIDRRGVRKPQEQPPLPDELPPALQANEMRAALENWLAYKAERREFYTPIGLQSLVSRIDRLARIHGAEGITDAMERAMAGNWSGWDHDIGKASQSAPSSEPWKPPSVAKIKEANGDAPAVR